MPLAPVRTRLLLAWLCLLGSAMAAEPGKASTPPASLDAKTLDKRVAPLLKAVALDDVVKAQKVRVALETHFQALQAWHAENHAKLAEFWSSWSGARSGAKDELHAALIGHKIDGLYATFAAKRQDFLNRLSQELSPEQIEKIKNQMTYSPGLQRTYDAYLKIVPQATESDKTYFWQTLWIAREKALDAISNKEKADQFKRQKVLIEAYIDAQGYDWKKSYAAYVDSLKKR